MPQCPNCKSKSVHRSRSRNQWERWRKAITHKLLYRCRNCSWRGWQAPVFSDEDHASEAHDRSTAPDPPNLRGTPLARADTEVKVDLTELDRNLGQPAKDES